MALPASAKKISVMTKPAERGGFEPPIESLIPITVFETAAFDHSATSPVESNLCESYVLRNIMRKT